MGGWAGEVERELECERARSRCWVSVGVVAVVLDICFTSDVFEAIAGELGVEADVVRATEAPLKALGAKVEEVARRNETDCDVRCVFADDEDVVT